MKLGIAVVYIIDDEKERLLDLQLAKIKECTTVPYIIYANANRLSHKYYRKLEADPNVKVCETAPTSLRGKSEHSYYLEHLVDTAVQNGATHVVTMHLDSFPIQTGWAKALDDKLSSTCAFATVIDEGNMGPYTACLFFRRDFCVSYAPRFLLSNEDLESSSYERFAKSCRHAVHSGAGYLYKAYLEGLSWYAMNRSRNSRYAHGAVYDDLIFHLGAGGRATSHRKLVEAAAGVCKPLLPVLARVDNTLIQKVLSQTKSNACRSGMSWVRRKIRRLTLADARRLLAEDPDAYVTSLRDHREEGQ